MVKQYFGVSLNLSLIKNNTKLQRGRWLIVEYTPCRHKALGSALAMVF